MARIPLNVSIPEELSEAARQKSNDTGIKISFVVERALAHWIATGEIPPAQSSAQKGEKKPKANK